jgi:REP element-mobilizing transposase RayT
MAKAAVNNADAHSKWLRVGRWSEWHACFSITKCVAGRRAALATDRATEIITNTLDFARKSAWIKLIGFSVMPDHCHLLFFLVGEKSLSDVMKSISRFTSRELNRHFGIAGTFWEEGFHDRRCRDEAEIENLLSYIEHNPVRICLVNKAEDWPYSSANPRWAHLLDREWYAQVR